jgi:hypothetical protein
MSQEPEILYTAEATVTGGREGHGRTSDGRLDVDLAVPSEMGGMGGPGTNPEQLFQRDDHRKPRGRAAAGPVTKLPRPLPARRSS